jgi:hypothetical protein
VRAALGRQGTLTVATIDGPVRISMRTGPSIE